MTTEVVDRLGHKVTRPNGVLQDGDKLSVPVRMMDSSPDFRGHKPGFAISDAYDAADRARVARDAKLIDRWKNAPPVATVEKQQDRVAPVTVNASAPLAELQAARDAAVAQRDKRLESAWAKSA